MLYRIPYTTDEGESGFELMEADSAIAAKRLVMARLKRNGLTDITLSTPIDITVKKGDDKVVDIPGEDSGADPEAEVEVEEIPSEAGGGGGKSFGGDSSSLGGDWDTSMQALLDAQAADFEKMMAETAERNQQRMNEQANEFNKRFETATGQYQEQLKKLESSIQKVPSATAGASDYGMVGAEGFDPNQIAADSMTEADRRMLLNMQSPLAGFREGMTRGLGGTPQNYLAKNYLEGFADPAQTAYRVLGGMAGQEGGDFTSYVENLFSGGSPRAQLGTMLGEGLEQLAGTGRAELAGMDPAKQRMFEQLTRPDITQEGGRANIQDVLGLAYGTQAQRFSPMILQQMRRGLPSQDELWADFQTQALGGGGDPNFARFVQQQFGL